MTSIASHTASGPAVVASTGSLSRSQRLMQATRSAHDRLDDRIISAGPFQTRDHYVRLLTMQYRFHRTIDGLYIRALPLTASLALPTRRRLEQVRQDLGDLGRSPPVYEGPEPFDAGRIDPATAIGWLWVAEGSTLGAASLLKRAAALGLGEAFGARHLADPPEGRGQYWKRFTRAVDAMNLDQTDDAMMLNGARDAFAHVRRLADDCFA